MYSHDILRTIIDESLNDLFSPALFADSIAREVRSDYIALLSVGISDEFVEMHIINAYNILIGRNDQHEANFWFALAYIQWKKGRLSTYTKQKAEYFLESDIGLQAWKKKENSAIKQRQKVLENLKKMLNTPMPPRKEIRKRSEHHSPWQSGDLLAYKITNDALKAHPLYMKYALLCVEHILQEPFSDIIPEAGHDESVCMSVYGWCSDEIPDTQIVEKINSIPIDESSFGAQLRQIMTQHQKELSTLHPELNQPEIYNKIAAIEQTKTIAYSSISMLHKQELKKRIVYIGKISSSTTNISSFFKTNICNVIFTTPSAFDFTLSEKLLPYYIGNK